MNEQLKQYKESLAIVDKMEDELYNMVAFLFKNVSINSKYYINSNKYFERLTYKGDTQTSTLRVSYWSCGEEEYEDYEVPNTILEKYFDGKKDEAKTEFVQFLKDDAQRRENDHLKWLEEQKEKAKIREQELAKQQEIDERKLYEKLKQKYGEN